jgi:hypothetical protein
MILKDIDLDDENENEESEVDKVSYQEILSEALAAEDVGFVITITKDSIATVEKGIKNAKSAARKRANARGIPWEAVTLKFLITEDANDPDWVDLRIFATRRATITIRKRPVSRAALAKIDLSGE